MTRHSSPQIVPLPGIVFVLAALVASDSEPRSIMRFLCRTAQDPHQRHVKRTRHGVEQDQRRIPDLLLDMLDGRTAHPCLCRQRVLGNALFQSQPLQLCNDILGINLRLAEIQIP